MSPSEDGQVMVSLPAGLYRQVIRPMLVFYGQTGGLSEAEQRAEERRTLLKARAVELMESDQGAFMQRLITNHRNKWAQRMLTMLVQKIETSGKKADQQVAKLREEIERLEEPSLKRLLGRPGNAKRPPATTGATTADGQQTANDTAPTQALPPPPQINEEVEHDLVMALSGWPRIS